MTRDMMNVIEQILDDGHLTTETLAQLRAAYHEAQPVPPVPREPVAWAEAVPWQGGLSNEELRREWELRLPGVEPTARELSAFAVGIEAGHKIVWVHDPDVGRVQGAAMQQALDALEYINTNCFILADHEGPLEQAIPALRKALAADALDRLAQADRELNLGEN